jgi:hypothetical protein
MRNVAQTIQVSLLTLTHNWRDNTMIKITSHKASEVANDILMGFQTT